MILFLLSLLAGVLTVLAPCTISLLPVIVGGTLAGGSNIRRVITVTASLGVSVILFTLILKVSTAFISVPQSFWQIVSGIIIIVLGITTLFPSLYDRLPFMSRLNRDSNKLMSSGYMKQNMLGDILVGASLGPVFSSCSPTYFLIIATVLPRSVLAGFIYLIAYAVGLCVTLFIVALAGQKLLARFTTLSDPNGWFKRGIGILFIIVGIAIFSGLDAKLELAFANSRFNISGIEQKLLTDAGPVTGGPAIAPGSSAYLTSTTAVGSTATSSDGRIAAEAVVYPKAPEITKPSGFLNTPNNQPITFAGEKGKVVLVDFWDYSCINCQREVPYVEAWYQKYASEGLEVVGVHTPEFAFEHLAANVDAAAKKLGITYPIVLDNDYGTWDAFNNEFWPQVYLINSDGFVVYSHSGEGDYAQTEQAIQKALTERDANEGLPNTVSTGIVDPSNAAEVSPNEPISPETYFGSNRNEQLENGSQLEPGTQALVLPASGSLNGLDLGGTWTFSPEFAQSTAASSGVIRYQFIAKNVYMVATGGPSATIKVLLNGKPVGSSAGEDVNADGTATIDQDRLYHLVSLPAYGTYTLQIEVTSGTLNAYTFTFG